MRVLQMQIIYILAANLQLCISSSEGGNIKDAGEHWPQHMLATIVFIASLMQLHIRLHATAQKLSATGSAASSCSSGMIGEMLASAESHAVMRLLI